MKKTLSKLSKCETFWSCLKLYKSHLNRDKFESNLNVPGIKGRHKNAVFKSFEMSPHLMCP